MERKYYIPFVMEVTVVSRPPMPWALFYDGKESTNLEILPGGLFLIGLLVSVWISSP